MFNIPNMMALADKYGSDKGSSSHHGHRYTTLYSFLFSAFRLQSFSMLEIGLQIGPEDQEHAARRIGGNMPSIAMWLEYFPNAFIYGLDISDFSGLKKPDRFEFIQADSGSRQSLQELKARTPRFKLIIDDGSHCPYHQQIAFSELFEKLDAGGVYIIEDLHWRNVEGDSVLPESPRTEDVFTSFLQTGMYLSPHVSEQSRLYIQDSVRDIYIHCDDRGGTDSWKIKMIAIVKK